MTVKSKGLLTNNTTVSILLIFLFLSKNLTKALSSSNTSAKNTCSADPTMLLRLSKIIPAQIPHWVGDGFKVYPVFGEHAFTESMTPFLMFDYAAPKHFPPSKSRKPKGVGRHPHRGFETVTIAFQGEVEHSDSIGSNDVIKTGDVQWMTAGRGIIHDEYHSKEFTKTGGTFEMCQLWVNLPKKYKMTKPRYQPISASSIPSVDIPKGYEDDNIIPGIVKVIAGSFHGVKGPAKTYSPVELWDVQLPTKDLQVELPFPENYNCVVFVRKGEIDLYESDDKSHHVGSQAVAIMKNEAGRNTLKVSAKQKNTSLLIMGGEPINEPIAARGPFVMNTWPEIQQAMYDYSSGKMGQ